MEPPKSRRRPGRFRAFKSLIYALLCIAVGGLLFRFFRPPAPVVKIPSAVVPTNSPVPRTAAVAVRPPPAVQASIVAQPQSGTRPVQTILEAQIALARLGISSGSIDGAAGYQTRSALMAFQRKEGITLSGALDSKTRSALQITLPALTVYSVTSNDLARLLPVPKTWLEKSQQPRLDFESILELLGEKSFANPKLIRALNPGVNWSNLTAGTTVILPRVQYPAPAGRIALVKISLEDRVLEAFDDESNLLVHFPCSIGRLAEKRPAGELHVTTVALEPNYTFDPNVFPESAEARQLGRKLIIPPGPNNPVGVAWIGLDRPGYGIHGTPAPEQVGRTESHGCFRLANWNAEYLASMAWVGMPVRVQ